MPWFRLDENVMDHPKFLALSDGAWRLWCEGLAFCQKHLTDGLIDTAALKGFRYYTGPRVKELTAVRVRGKGACWESQADGFQVHDYLGWNDPRESVLKARQDGIDRKRRWRDSHAGREPSGTHPGTRTAPRASHVMEGNGTSPDLPSNDHGRTGSREVSAIGRDELAERAGRFVHRFAEIFTEYRRGAKYHSKPTLDFQEALGLCQTWDDSRLETLTTAFFTTDDAFCRNGNGSIAQFRSRASWCDAKLKEAGL